MEKHEANTLNKMWSTEKKAKKAYLEGLFQLQSSLSNTLHDDEALEPVGLEAEDFNLVN